MSKLGTAIERAVRSARALGIGIVRRPMFDWHGSEELPRLCNATGAVLLEMGLGRDRPKDWPEMMCAHLGCSQFDLWRLRIGWNVGNVIQVELKDKSFKDDALSSEMNRLAKRLCGS